MGWMASCGGCECMAVFVCGESLGSRRAGGVGDWAAAATGAFSCCASLHHSPTLSRRSRSQPRFFGGGFGGGGGDGEDEVQKGHDVYADLLVTLKDLYMGREIKVGCCC